MGRRRVWNAWYSQCCVIVLADAMAGLDQIGIPLRGIVADLVKLHSLKRDLQNTVAKRITEHTAPDPEERVRYKIQRWKLQGPAAHISRRVHRRLCALQNLVAPTVSAACFSAIWNRWTTARRFQKRHLHCNTCVLGCSTGAEDSIEHYACCSAVREVGCKYLRLWRDTCPETFMLADPRMEDEGDLICVAILVYATYMATNHFRRQGGTDLETATDALEQFCRNGVKGHPSSQRVIDGRWTQTSAQRHRAPKKQRIGVC